MQGLHFFGYCCQYLFFEYIEQAMTDKIPAGRKHYLPCRTGNGKRTYQFLLFFVQLRNSQFGNEGDSFSAFYHTHKGFHTSQMVGHLIDFDRFHLAETYKLVTEAMPFVQ